MKLHSSRVLWMAFKMSLVACAITILSASQAHAEEHLYPGSFCVRWSGSEEVGYLFSAIENRSFDEVLRVDCPVVRTSLGIGVGGSIFKGRVRVNDRNTTAGVTCTLVATSRFPSDFDLKPQGEIRASRDQEGTFAGEIGVRELHFGPLDTNDPLVYYYYSCVIPARDVNTGEVSSIFFYTVEERS